MPTQIKQLKEKQDELTSVRDKLKKAFEEGKVGTGPKTELDVDKITSYTGNFTEKLAAIRKDQMKSNDLQDVVSKLYEMDLDASKAADGIPDLEKEGDGDGQARFRQQQQNQRPYDVADELMKHDKMKSFIDHKDQQTIILDDERADDAILKATFLRPTDPTSNQGNSASGWGTETTRIGLVVGVPDPPPSIIDTIRTGRTTQSHIVWMQETAKVSAAAERAENASYAESRYALEEQSTAVQSLGHRIPVTDEQLQDVPQSRDYLNMRMREGIRRRLDRQIYKGGGTAPNLQGISTLTGLPTIAVATGGIAIDGILKAITDVIWTGDANPNIIYIHPDDWYRIRITRAVSSESGAGTGYTGSSEYLFGPPFASGQTNLWGLRVVLTNQAVADTCIVGDTNYCQLWIRRGVEVLTAYNDVDFQHGRITIRAGVRAAFTVYRVSAFKSVSNLDAG